MPGSIIPITVRESLTQTAQRAVLCLPLRVDDETVRVLAVGDVTGRVFDGVERRLLEAFADQAAVTLHLSDLHQRTRKQLTQTQIVLAVSQSVGAVPHPSGILRRTLRELGRSLGADMAGAWLLESGLRMCRGLRRLRGHDGRHRATRKRRCPS